MVSSWSWCIPAAEPRVGLSRAMPSSGDTGRSWFSSEGLHSGLGIEVAGGAADAVHSTADSLRCYYLKRIRDLYAV